MKWSEYREPHTQFIKATTCPNDIADKLEKVFLMRPERKQRIIANGQKYIQEEFCVDKTVARLKKIILETHANFVPTVKEEPPKQVQPNFKDLLDKDDEGKRIAIVIPQSEQDVFLVNSLVENVKKTYPDHNLYFITKPEYYELIEDNPFIHKLIPYQDGVDSLFLLEGKGQHKGYFEIAFFPHATTQKFFAYHHNGKDVTQFKL